MVGIFRTASQSSPSTAPAFSARVTKRATTTATRPIKESGKVINISGYATVTGNAISGSSAAVSGLRRNKQIKSAQVAKLGLPASAPAYRSARGLFR